jgi:hypothetical protein
MNPDANASLANTIAVTSGRRLEKLSRERGAGGCFVGAARENPPRIERNAMLLQPLAQSLESMLRVNRVPRPAGERDPGVTKLHQVIRHDHARTTVVATNELHLVKGFVGRDEYRGKLRVDRAADQHDLAAAISRRSARRHAALESIRRRCRDRIDRSAPCWPASGCCLVWTTPSRCQPAAA